MFGTPFEKLGLREGREQAEFTLLWIRFRRHGFLR